MNGLMNNLRLEKALSLFSPTIEVSEVSSGFKLGAYLVNIDIDLIPSKSKFKLLMEGRFSNLEMDVNVEGKLKVTARVVEKRGSELSENACMLALCTLIANSILYHCFMLENLIDIEDVVVQDFTDIFSLRKLAVLYQQAYEQLF